jgi:DNA-binding NarL/FixJ family response regulator
VIADRSALVRIAVRSALEEQGIAVVAEAGDAAGARRAIVAQRPDAALVDLELDDRLAVLAELRRELPGTALIALSPDESDTRAIAAVRAGACGFVPKDTAPDRLPDIVRGAIRGEAAIPRRVVRRMLERMAAPGALGGEGDETLSPREWQILECMSQGKSDRLIGEELGVSEITVRRHAATAAHKLHAGHREDAVAAFRRLVA